MAPGIAACALLLAVAAPTCLAGAAAVRMSEPRAFGYFIGDVIERRALLQLPEGARLDAASLPRTGRVDALLALHGVEIVMHRTGHELRVRYQVVGAPQNLTAVTLPQLRVPLTGDPGDLRLPAFQVTVGPLTSPAVSTSPGLPLLRPDHVPVASVYGGTVVRSIAFGLLAAALVTAALLALRQGRASDAEAPFRVAWRALRRLRNTDTAAEGAAFAALHQAIAATAGRTVFASDLAPLFSAQPALRPAAAELATFFAWSREHAFGRPGTRPRVAELKALAQRLARLEGGRSPAPIAEPAAQRDVPRPASVVAALTRRVQRLRSTLPWVIVGLAVVASALLMREVLWLRHLRVLNGVVAESLAPGPSRDPRSASTPTDSPALAFARAFGAARAGEDATALAGYREAARDPRFSPAAHYNLGNLHIRQALRTLRDPALDAQARSETAAAAFARAREAYRQALRAEPGLWDARYNLERLLRLAPDDAPTHAGTR
jgi:mxaA protein